MRFFKNNILEVDEHIIDNKDLFQTLNGISSGSYIYQVSPEQYDFLMSLDVIDRLTTINESHSELNRIGFFNRDLIGCPLVFCNHEDKLNARSFVFIGKNPEFGITRNDFEIVDNYPSISETRDIGKYNRDFGIFTDEPFESIVKSLISNTQNHYHVDSNGFLFFNTPTMQENYEEIYKNITGQNNKRRKKITKTQALDMLNETCNASGNEPKPKTNE